MPTKKNKLVKGKDGGLKSDKSGRTQKKAVRLIEHFYSKAKTPELLFTLYSDGRIEASEEVDSRLWMELTGINDAEGKEERARMSKALLRLVEYYGRVNQKPELEDAELGPLEVPAFLEPDPRELLDELAATLGKRVADIAETRCVENKKGGKSPSDRVRFASQELGDLVQYAAEGINRWKMSIRQTIRKSNLSWMIYQEAKNIIRYQKRLPTRNEIRQRLEADGWDPKGNTAWSDAFSKAGLGGLEKGGKYRPLKPMNPAEGRRI